jgi:hypothetical protein
MLNKFWENIGTKVADRWLEIIFGPAFLFWAGGLGLYAWQIGWQKAVNDFQTRTPFQQGSWSILGLLILIFSSIAMQSLHFTFLRLMEGYWPWPFSYLRMGIVKLRKLRFEKKYAKLRKLASLDKADLSTGQREEFLLLDHWAHWHPVDPKDLLPTKLGNILRAREFSPERKYGLDAIICWSRLWLLLPERVRTDLTETRIALDRLAELFFWGFLFTCWFFLSPWALVISLLWMGVTYWVACQHAASFGDLLESAFDLHRFLLYDAIGWHRPKNTQEEKDLGKQLTEYLWRGTLPKPLTYQHKEK